MIELTDADWNALLEKFADRKTVLVIGDNLTKVKEESLVEYISKSLFNQVKKDYYERMRKLKVPEQIINDNFNELKLPTNSSIMNMNWWDYSDAFKSTESGDLVHFIKKTIDDIPSEDLNYDLLESILSIGKYKVILSTSYSNDYKRIVEKWAQDSELCFFYADIQNEGLIISPPMKGLFWDGSDDQLLFINLVGHSNSNKRSLDHILVTEEDIILFVFSWIFAIKKGKLSLADRLKDSFLLVLGCHAPSWAFKLIWYVIKNPTLRCLSTSDVQSLCSRPDTGNVDAKEDDELKLVVHYSTKIIDSNETELFITELKERWFLGGYNESETEEVCDTPPKQVDVFVSYASEDRNIVEDRILPILKTMNETNNVSFWYDKQNLRPSNDWDSEIEFAISHTNVFLALQTSNSKKICSYPKIKYLKHEWALAESRNKQINKDYEAELQGRFSMILPILSEPIADCLYAPIFSKYQCLSMDDTDFAENLEKSILQMIEDNRRYS